MKYEKDENIDYLLPGDSTVYLSLKGDEYWQLQDFTVVLEGSLSDIDKVTDGDLKYGRMPENNKEIVVDEMVLNNTIDYNEAKLAGLNEPVKFLDREIVINHMANRKIVGITDMGNPCIYTDRSIFINLLNQTA